MGTDQFLATTIKHINSQVNLKMESKTITSPENCANTTSNSSEEDDAFDQSPRSSNLERITRNSTINSTTLINNQKTGASSRRGSQESHFTNNSSRRSSIKTNFSSTLNVRAFDKDDTVNSIIGESENGGNLYETMNFRLDSFGKILKVEINELKDELQVKHSTMCLEKITTQISQENLDLMSFTKTTSKKVLPENKPVHKVNIVNLCISDHVEGQVTALKVFENQECHVWFTTDGWKTFQETIAVKVQGSNVDVCEKMGEKSSETEVCSIQNSLESKLGRNSGNKSGNKSGSKSSSNQLVIKTEKSSNNTALIKYKFDFIIPKLDKDGNINDFDRTGRPLNVQFHPILRSDRVLYLDYDFKIYSIKLRPEFQVL